jgi:hypothetical protein
MNGAFGEVKFWSRDKRVRRSWKSDYLKGKVCSRVSAIGAESMGVLPRFLCDFFLFYLTGAMIFGNRPGLLKKFDSARAAETLSAVKPHE